MNKDFDINNNLERKFPFSYQWFSSGDKEQDKILKKTLEKLPDNISTILLSFIDKHKNTKQWDELKTPFFQFVQNFLKTNNFNFLNQISLTYPEFGEMKNQISNYPNNLKSGYYPQIHDTVTINPGGFKVKNDIVTPKASSIGKTLFATSYYGLSQRVGKHTQIQAGLLHDGPQNTDLKVFKLMQGHKNSQFSVTFAADSIELSKAKNFSIFSGIKWEF